MQKVIHGNNIDVLKSFPDNHFDAVVTDPPYGLGKEPDATEVMQAWVSCGYHEIKGSGFMGKEWDAFVPQPLFWKEVYRVLKHGGHVLSFFGTRTYDWGVMAMRFAGFEVRDCIQWLYGSGFPKSHNISKAIDKIGGRIGHSVSDIKDIIISKFNQSGFTISEFNSLCGFEASGYMRKSSTWACILPSKDKWQKIKIILSISDEMDNLFEEAEREILGKNHWKNSINHFKVGENHKERVTLDITAPATEEAKKWDGWGSALKPANEPIVLARKPLEKGLSIAENVLKWGTGGINIDGCRVSFKDDADFKESTTKNQHADFGTAPITNNQVYGDRSMIQPQNYQPTGRFPANIILTHSNYQVMNLVGNIDSHKLAEIIRYFYGYTKVSDLRERKRSATKQDKCRDEVLQSGMQETISQKEYNSQQSSSELSELSNSICSDERALSDGEEKVLQSLMQRPTSEITEGGKSNKIWEEAYGGIQEENGGNQDKEWNNTIERKASELEGGKNLQQGVYKCDDFNTPDRLATNSKENETKSIIHSRTSNCDGDGTQKTTIGFGECSSHQRDKERQQTEQFGVRGQSQSFKNTSEDRCGNGSIKEREPILEVLDFDIPTEWLRYFEYTGEQLGCTLNGLKKVKGAGGGQGNHVGKNINNEIFGKGYVRGNVLPYADENGEETVEDWNCHPDCPIRIMDEQSFCMGMHFAGNKRQKDVTSEYDNTSFHAPIKRQMNRFGDSGGASRFFYCAKASKGERNKGLHEFEEKRGGMRNSSGRVVGGQKSIDSGDAYSEDRMTKNFHPTVKPIKLMQYLVRLITPPNGLVLDPFAGSGTTGIAAKLEGFSFIGIEQDAEYCKIAEARIQNFVEDREEEKEINDNSTSDKDENSNLEGFQQLSLF